MASNSALPSHFQDWNVSKRSVPKVDKTVRLKLLVKRPWCIAVIVAIAVAILIAIIVPLAVLLPKGKKHNATLILPLYIYPETTTTWDPLYDALAKNPKLKVLVIVNPSSGPGSTQFPDERYSVELERLSGYSNVETVGYVRTGYASRNLTDVIAEVATFSGWASRNSSYAMHGIFFDESPHQYSAEAVEFMRSACEAVKQADGLLGERTVIRNPGVIPDARFHDTNTDITVVFEESYPTYEAKQESLAELPKHRSEYSYMIHSVPTMDRGKLGGFVDGLSKRAEYLFVTTNDENYYESFGSDWSDFAGVVPS